MKQGKDVSILLVDDSPDDAELARACLRNGRVANSVIWLRDGEEALDYVLRNCVPNGPRTPTPPGLILLDLHMPKIGGMELLRLLKTNDAAKNIPIVMMTGSDEEHDILGTYNLGTNGYIVKPLVFAAFVEAAREAGFEWLVTERKTG